MAAEAARKKEEEARIMRLEQLRREEEALRRQREEQNRLREGVVACGVVVLHVTCIV